VQVVENVPGRALLELNLAGNQLTELGGLKAAKRLTALDLSENRLAGALALPGLPALEQLRLSGNNLDGIVAMAARCPALLDLELRENGLVLRALAAEGALPPGLTELAAEANPAAADPSYRATLAARVPALEMLDNLEVARGPPARPDTARGGRPADAAGGVVPKPLVRPPSARTEALTRCRPRWPSHSPRRRSRAGAGRLVPEMEVGADLFARLKTLRASLASETPVRPSMAEALPARLGLDRARRRQWAMVEALPRSSVTHVGGAPPVPGRLLYGARAAAPPAVAVGRPGSARGRRGV
jgi:hypothetical protein